VPLDSISRLVAQKQSTRPISGRTRSITAQEDHFHQPTTGAKRKRPSAIFYSTYGFAMKGHMKTKRTKSTRRHSKLLLKLSSWGNYIDEAYQLESMLAKEPARLQIDFVGSGEIPADSALLMRSMILKRSPQTHIVTHARSSLQGASLLIWLLGDTRLIREDARLHFRPAGPFIADEASTTWKDRSFFDDDDMEEEDYIRVLQAINEFLPVKELAGRPVEVSVLKEFGLIDNEGVDDRLATAFGRVKERPEKHRTSRKKEPVKEACR
jgi:hypothetical protein